MSRRAAGFPVLLLTLLMVPPLAPTATASDLLAATVGAADTGMAAADLAAPRSAASAQFANPAGLARFDTSLTLGAGLAWGTGKMHSTVPEGYDPYNSVVAMIPEVAYVRRGNGPWSFGLGMHGTVGIRYDYSSKPSVDIDNDFFAEVTTMAMPLTLAYRADERLWLGIQIMPLFGYFRSHFAIPSYTPGFDSLFRPRFKLTGPGLTAMAGVTWHATEHVALALSARPQGRVWMDGSSLTPDGERQDTDLHLDVPAEASAGLTLTPARDWTLAYSVRWIDASALGDSKVRFEETSDFNFPFIPDAKDEWRHALGAEWRPSSRLALRLGLSHADHIVGNHGITPLSYDGDDTRLYAGAGWKAGAWSFDFAAVYKLPDSRDVRPEDAAMLPGHYRTGGAVLALFAVTRELE